jgi:hypothetical protein
MKRQKKTAYLGDHYPDIRRYVRLYSRKAGMGLVVGVAATGCIWPWQQVSGDMVWVDTGDTGWQDTGAIPGDIGETGEIYYQQLPASGERNLQFEDPVWGWIDYRVDFVLEDRAVYDWIVENPEAALAAIDAALLQHVIIDFDNYIGDTIIENEIKQAIIDAMTGALGGDISPIREASLVIVNYTDENDIDGDIG